MVKLSFSTIQTQNISSLVCIKQGNENNTSKDRSHVAAMGYKLISNNTGHPKFYPKNTRKQEVTLFKCT